ncbi:hypothetical protein OE88DRAFT_1623516 [Heliocybe sulcata]|uniref:AN1-type domain-containing protein n=1 Tax=Heliocybe sulcata TaxID=5364 RepID=A0A5C3NBW8_9AGAM|nr:hypothetical protein OE88DRAFT_1623516 [Heliocybe sulcata]
MDLQEIGAHCSVQSCNELDFLPIKCGCERFFCRHHISPDAHECTSSSSSATVPGSTSLRKLERCALDSCNKPSLESYVSDAGDHAGRQAALCPRCHLAFCAAHRYPESHSCSAADPTTSQPPKNEAAQALLQKHFPPSGSQKTVKPSTTPKTKDPKKLAQLQKVQVMKMRHQAGPGDPRDKSASVAVDQRLHVRVTLENSDQEKIFWFRKSIGAGKALDCLAAHFSLSSSDARVRTEALPLLIHHQYAL